MRKVIVEMDPNFIFRVVSKDIFKIIEYIEGRALLKMDYEKGEKLTIYDIKMKPGHRPEEMKILGEVKLLKIMKQEGDVYTCLAWGRADKKTIKLMHWLKIKDLDVIYDLPFFVSKDKFVFSAIGENDDLKRLLKVMKLMGKVRSTHFQKATFTEHNILSCLTDKQKEVVVKARKMGYYDYPKKVSSQDLADNLGISRATTIEHLRKAESRLMETILAGY
jgi:hypothetical protein